MVLTLLEKMKVYTRDITYCIKIMNRKLTVLFFTAIIALPLSVFALTSCHNSDAGCTLEQLIQLNTEADSLGLAKSEHIAIIQEIIGKLNAQITKIQSGSTTNTSSAVCLTLNNSLVLGSTDATTNGEVSKLQQFLGTYKSNKLYTIAPNNQSGASAEDLQPVTGYYGSKTAANVVEWQKAHGMDFVTTASGVGPMTRAKMREACQQTNVPPVINSISPAAGPIGTTITISGSGFLGFEGDKYLWVKNVSGVKGLLYGEPYGSDTSVRAVLPTRLCQTDVSYSGKDCPAYLDLVPGIYTIEATGWGGTSNSISFTVTAK
jgi:peptidoglycan hydrolase-like protein with peptidoglycan-binding domain